MAKRTLIKILCAVLALLAAVPLSGCGAETEARDSGTEREIDFETLPEDAPYSVQDFELTNVMEVFAREADSDYAVASPSFAADHTVFEALFNLILYFEMNTGDGECDDYDEYIEQGLLDLQVSVKQQDVPGKDISWYSATRSRAMKVCFDVFHYFEYAKANSMSPISRLNEAKIQKIMGYVDAGYFGSDITRYFGEGATLPVLRAAAALYVIADDPSAFVAVPSGI